MAVYSAAGSSNSGSQYKDFKCVKTSGSEMLCKQTQRQDDGMCLIFFVFTIFLPFFIGYQLRKRVFMQKKIEEKDEFEWGILASIFTSSFFYILMVIGWIFYS